MREGKPCNIIVTQPRRIAAVSVSRRVCSERDWQLGALCGYQIGLDGKHVSDDTLITYVTTGVLLQKLVGKNAEANFHRYTHIILDEVHERDLDTDFVMLLIKLKSYGILRSKVILMSATLDSATFAKYFGDPEAKNPALLKAPVLTCENMVFEVKEFYWSELVSDNSFISATLCNSYKEFTEQTRQFRCLNNAIKRTSTYTSRSLQQKQNQHHGHHRSELGKITFYGTISLHRN